ncbi:hypothetical protein CsatB_009148 [Cannabis sativa]
MVRVISLGFLSFLLSQPTTTNHSYPENNLEKLTPQTLRTEPRNFLAKLVATTHYRVVWSRADLLLANKIKRRKRKNKTILKKEKVQRRESLKQLLYEKREGRVDGMSFKERRKGEGEALHKFLAGNDGNKP